jgi:hypothetical protein
MADAGLADRFEELRQQQRSRAELLTRLHTWRVAAVITLFQSPLGLVFGVLALWLLRGLGPRIRRRADRRSGEEATSRA